MTTPTPTQDKFPESYFHSEILSFRDCFGNKEWWKKPEENREACLKALSFVYFNTVNEDGSAPTPDKIQQWFDLLEQTMNEYEQRKLMLARLTAGFYKPRSRA